MFFSSIEIVFFFLLLVRASYYLLPYKWGPKSSWLRVAGLGCDALGEFLFVFASEGRLDESLALRPREQRLLDLVLAADSPERLREVFARERAEKKGRRK